MDGFHGRIKPNGPEHEDLKNEKRFVMTVYFPTRSLTIDLTLLHEPVLQFISPLKFIVLYGKSQRAQCSGESNFLRNRSRLNANVKDSFMASSSFGYIGTFTSHECDFE